jgi:hypothetical protein
MEAAGRSAALYQRHDDVLEGRAGLAAALRGNAAAPGSAARTSA